MATVALLGEVRFSRPAVRIVGRVLELTKLGVTLQVPGLDAGNIAALAGACGSLAVADKRGIYSGEVRVHSIEDSTIKLIAADEIVGNDRRTSNRRKVEIPVAYRFVRDGLAVGVWAEARLSDLSIGGMKAHFRVRPEVGSSVDLRFSLPLADETSKSGNNVRSVGRILHVVPDTRGEFAAEISFKVVGQADRLRLHHFTRDDGYV